MANCRVCSKPSVGYRSHGGEIRHYCSPHWYAVNSKFDKWYLAQCEKQWGDQDWYKKIVVDKPRKKTKNAKLAI
jgi:hypothetical protein